jgi:PKD repeat protein
MLHTWEEAGTYTVTVTASDGRTSVTDTTTVLVEAQPKAEGTVDENGGAVSQGACAVSVPEGLAPEPFTLAVTELPSMQGAAERTFELGEVTALGNAYDVVMPLKPATPVSISVRDPEAQGVDPSELAWLVRMVGRPLPPPDQPDFVYSAAPLAAYVLVPVTGVDEDGTARGEIYGHKRFQLVRLDEPLNAESVELEGEAAEKALPPIKPIIIFKRNPSRITITNYKNAIIEGFNKSRSVLLGQKQFRGPEGAVVYVGKLSNPKYAAFVPFFDHHTIHMSYTLASEDEVKKVFAHEFFHLIQNHYSNRVSEMFYQDSDGWFNEGTASWAMDEVFDEIQGMYHATPWPRF